MTKINSLFEQLYDKTFVQLEEDFLETQEEIMHAFNDERWDDLNRLTYRLATISQVFQLWKRGGKYEY